MYLETHDDLSEEVYDRPEDKVNTTSIQYASPILQNSNAGLLDFYLRILASVYITKN
jgi:hypothetical protein